MAASGHGRADSPLPEWLSALALGYLVVVSVVGLLFFFVLVPLLVLGGAIGALVEERTLRALLKLGLLTCVALLVLGLLLDTPSADGTGGGTEYLAPFGLYGLAAAVCACWARRRSQRAGPA